MINSKDVTIIIPHLGNTLEQKYAFENCRRSLLDSVPEIIVRGGLIVATNGFDPATQSIPNQIGDIHIVNQGQCKAVNAAAAMVNTEWLFITNDDMIYAPNWFEKLTALIIGPEVMCISPMLIEPRPGAPTFETYFCGGAGGDFDKKKWLEYAAEKFAWENQGLRTGFNFPLLIKKELWDLVGGYDIVYDPWGSNSDSDLEYKIMLAGIQPYQNKDSLVYHFSQTSGTFEPRNNSSWAKNWDYFIKKWGFPRTDQGIWEANFEIPDEGRMFRPWWEGHYK